MSVSQSNRQRLMAEIDRLVAEAIAGRAIIVTDDIASRVARDFPGAGLSLAQISDEITRRGIEAGAALEFGEAR
ncbi:MAG: hypothetical protein J0H94_12925 [Rhizobiales bacterium]|nr:hypothetical protein [Hyphomicrobiales bacterium]